MNQIFNWLICIGLIGVGLYVILFGLQIMLMLGAGIFFAIASFFNWIWKELTGKPEERK